MAAAMNNLQQIDARVHEMLAQQLSLDRFVDKFTEKARQALASADEEAALLNHRFIGTEHILLGLLHEGTGLGAKVLNEVGVDLQSVRSFVERLIKRGEPLSEGEKVARPLTPRAQVVLTMAVGETWRRQYIGTEHLLLALLREGEGVAAGAIENLAGPLDDVRTKLYRAMISQNIAAEPLKDIVSKNKSNVVTCRIDDQDLSAIDALIEVGIRSTRSDAAAWLIHTGILANQNLLETVYTTVAEIRNLRAQAQALAQQVVGNKLESPEVRSEGPSE
jgi:hypothetical protein